MANTRGFVLVNALVIVAALSAVAVFLLARSEAGRARLDAGTMAEQVTLNLDAFDAYAASILARDSNMTDHKSEAWAQPLPPVDLLQGSVSGEIRDLQGLFNVNWLADPENTLAQTAFDRLLAALSVPPQVGTEIQTFLRPGGPKDRVVWRSMAPALDPVGGAILSMDQLRVLPGLTDRHFDRLRPFLAALPGDTLLNINTADYEILSAFLPNVPPAALARILAARDMEPFPSPESFLIATGLATAEDTEEENNGNPDTQEDRTVLTQDRISVSSDWFHVHSQTKLGRQTARRETVLFRKTRPAVTASVWHQSSRP
ncbi:MAG: type II secretion system minor pseudopilin GspK [Pelagimonas sp.]|uniref:type II secretion system minor pseudopilin GspK n=1 Tax=Pelagimonas sp. TaxID=2073170 RepID=UPI003D6BE3D9